MSRPSRPSPPRKPAYQPPASRHAAPKGPTQRQLRAGELVRHALIEIMRSEIGRIDVVLLDLTMPRMDGIETLAALRRIAPEIPVVLTSGYGSTRLDDDPENRCRPDAVLPKPYAAEDLVETLKRVMAARR